MGAVPRGFGDFFVPVLGGGAAAVAVLQQHPGHTAVLASTDRELLNVWQAVADDVDGVVMRVKNHIGEHDARHFAAVRGEEGSTSGSDPAWGTGSGPASGANAERAARVVYLAGAARAASLPASFTDFSGATVGRESVAFDENNLRALAALLRAGDVRFDARPFFALLNDIREDDLVWLEPAAGILNRRPREVSSFIAAVTAKAAFLLAPAPTPDAPQNFYADLPSMTIVDDRPGGEVIWGNRSLARSHT